MKSGKSVFLFACLLGIFAVATADVRLPAVIGGNMVLQQNSSAPIWGWAQAGEKVTVRGSWAPQRVATATANQAGRWKTSLRTPKAGGPYTVTIEGNNTITLHNVLIGEVWVCSGQSNMEWSMKQLNAMADIENAHYPQIRLFQLKRVLAESPQEDCQGSWQECSPATVEGFSATGYLFGRELHRELEAPVGLIHTSWGGTPAESWTSLEVLREQFPEFEPQIDMVLHPEAHLEAVRRENERKIAEYEKALARIDRGTQQNWQDPALDVSDWKEMELPQKWSATELSDIDGVVWFRRVTNLPPSWASSELELKLGPIDDIDTVWVNGVRVGATKGWETARTYRIPASALRVGPNVIAVRVIDTENEGGMWGTEDQMRIGPVGADPKVCATLARTWKYKVSMDKLPSGLPKIPAMTDKPYNYRSPIVLFDAMISPLLSYRIAGAVWYQGESNVGRHDQYSRLFPAMIRDWRSRWGCGEFPFYYVQIAPYRYSDPTAIDSALLRESQLKTLSAVENVGMAVTMDIGEKNNIHPRNKQDVGRRLALWALAKTYGKDVAYCGPIYREMRVENGAVRLFFDYADGLTAKGGPLKEFVIAGEDRVFVPAEARIEGDTVVVSSEQVKSPVAVRCAFTNWAQPNLYNGAGLPASSFRTDDWQ